MKTSIVLMMLVPVLVICVGAVQWLRSGPRASQFAYAGFGCGLPAFDLKPIESLATELSIRFTRGHALGGL